MKIKSSLKKRCNKCKFIRRDGRVLVTCEIAKHKQAQG